MVEFQDLVGKFNNMKNFFFFLAVSGIYCSNLLAQIESKKDWDILIQPEGLDGWHYYQDKKNKKNGWSNSNGILTFDSSFKKGRTDHSLVTDKQFSSFKIYFEWKVSPGSNSGFMWGVREDNKYKHPYSTGPEIQILDRDFTYEDGSLPNPKHTAGALYDLVAPEKNVTKKAGEWNSFLITIDHVKNYGEVIHNGTKVSTFQLSGENWEKMVKNSKFSNYSDKSFKHGDFGKFKKGHLVIQDHPGIISYRNMKILEIN